MNLFTFLKSRCPVNVHFSVIIFIVGAAPAILIEKNSISSFEIALKWLFVKIAALLTAYLFWRMISEIPYINNQISVFQVIFIGALGGVIGGLVVNVLSESFDLQNQTEFLSRILGSAFLGAIWLPSLSTANNNLEGFKARESEIKASLVYQDEIQFKQSKIFEFMIGSSQQSIQQKLSVTALEARSILDQHLNNTSSREEIPEIVSRIATQNFRDLSHAVGLETTLHVESKAVSGRGSLWNRIRNGVDFPAVFNFNPVLSPVPFSLIISLFCAATISRNATPNRTGLYVLIIFFSNLLILQTMMFLLKKSPINRRLVTFTSIMCTAIIPPLLLKTVDKLPGFGSNFQGSNFYSFSYFVLSLVLSALGFFALLVKTSLNEIEMSLQSQYREGVDREKLVNIEIARLAGVFAKYIHGNLQSSLVSLSGNLKVAVKNGDSARAETIIDEILQMLKNPELDLNRKVDDLQAEVLKKIALWDGLVDIQPEIQIDERDFSPHTVTQVMDCVEEMISNAVRHGKASAITLSVQQAADGTLLLTCTDNGQLGVNPLGGLGFKIYQDASNGDWTISRSPKDNLTIVKILISS